MAELWVVGSLNVDLMVGCRRFPEPGETLFADSLVEQFGGKGGNQAMALAKLGCRPRLVAAVGDDARGRAYLGALQQAGVDTSHVKVRPGVATGLALIEVAGGENRILVVPGANATLAPSDLEAALSDLRPGDVVLFQLELPMESVVHALAVAHGRGALVVLDPAPATRLGPDVLRLVDVLTPNQTEAELCAATADQPGRALVAAGCAVVVQKCGAEGALLVTASEAVRVPAFAAAVIDTVGAGDAFNAGLGAAVARGLPMAEAVRWGNAAGALSTRGAGAQSSQASCAELQALLG